MGTRVESEERWVKWIEVEASGPLYGSVRIPGAKNSSLALVAAACMADDPVTLIGIPDLLDIRVIGSMCEDLGIRIARSPIDGSMTVDASRIRHASLDVGKSSSFRASYYFVGALLGKFGKVRIGYPGGDDFVSRPIDQHIKAWRAMGAEVFPSDDHYEVRASSRLRGADIYFDTITSGATMNTLMAAATARGTTILRNAARDPEVVDTANLLNQMGARIVGAGTDTIRIEGVPSLRGCTYQVIPDRLIAGAFLAAAAATGGSVTVEDVIPEHLGSCLAKLTEIGVEIESGDTYVRASYAGKLRAARIRTGMYPLFATDLQQPFTALLLQAPGRSIVNDRVYPNRFSHVPQLRRMGASIEIKGSAAIIDGARPLRGDWVHATDVRAGTCLVMAGLCAEGVTRITGVEHIERGYEDAVGLFRSLGANIRFRETSGEAEQGDFRCSPKNANA
ncbi:UDP-N-acetylglucosamine 1-carboxyvinyltransferase [Paenibacillus thermoaerophilus]